MFTKLQTATVTQNEKPVWEKGFLHLESGLTFEGRLSPWSHDHVSGEAVFTTGMTGYPQTLTDPSFKEQLLTFTYPLIGNYGMPPHHLLESDQVHLHGLIVNQLTHHKSHSEAVSTLSDFLQEHRIPVLTDVDTRALTKVLRTHGSRPAVLSFSNEAPDTFYDPNTTDLVEKVSCKKITTYGSGKSRLCILDCGMKNALLKICLTKNLTVVRVPYDTPFEALDFDALLLSNGPGDPSRCIKPIEFTKKAINKNIPIFGICLGAQLLAHAVGAKTYKLPFGHRGQNQPCQHLKTKKCLLTSQNHGFAIDAASLPKDFEVTFKNLNDGSVEGISHKTKPFSAVQFHPEASPGPLEGVEILTHFLESFIQ